MGKDYEIFSHKEGNYQRRKFDIITKKIKKNNYRKKIDLKNLERRYNDLKIDSKIGKQFLIKNKNVKDLLKIFFCKICEIEFNDSLSYVEHMNSLSHNRRLGMNMKVGKSKVSVIKRKLGMKGDEEVFYGKKSRFEEREGFGRKSRFEVREDFEKNGKNIENRDNFENRDDFEKNGKNIENKDNFKNRDDFENGKNFENTKNFENGKNFENTKNFENGKNFEGDFENGKKDVEVEEIVYEENKEKDRIRERMRKMGFPVSFNSKNKYCLTHRN